MEIAKSSGRKELHTQVILPSRRGEQLRSFFFHPLFTSRHVFSCIKQLLYALLWCEKGRDLIKNSRGTGKKFSFAFFLLIEIRTFSVEITLEKAQRRRGAERYSKLSMHENGKTIRGFSRAQRN
jgi:hypothetical protein